MTNQAAVARRSVHSQHNRHHWAGGEVQQHITVGKLQKEGREVEGRWAGVGMCKGGLVDMAYCMSKKRRKRKGYDQIVIAPRGG